MLKATLIHNPRCSKSRGAKDILEDLSIEFVTIDYLQDGLTRELLKTLPKLLGMPFEKMVRIKETSYIDLNLSDKKLSENEWIDILIKNPILLEARFLLTVIKQSSPDLQSLFGTFFNNCLLVPL